MSNPSQTTPILLHPPLLIEDSIAHMGRTAGIVNRRLIGDLTGLVQIEKLPLAGRPRAADRPG